MKQIIFLHGFFASGQCVPALALKKALADNVEVLTPDLPMHPNASLAFIQALCEQTHPDLLVGNSCGAFLAQLIAPTMAIPALLGNPHFEMTKFLQVRMGAHRYKSPRRDGKQDFVIDQSLVEAFGALESNQFAHCQPAFRDKIWGLFGEQDTLAHYEPLFLQHYNHSFHFPGGHTPTAEEVKLWYVPLINDMLRSTHPG